MAWVIELSLIIQLCYTEWKVLTWIFFVSSHHYLNPTIAKTYLVIYFLVNLIKTVLNHPVLDFFSFGLSRISFERFYAGHHYEKNVS